MKLLGPKEKDCKTKSTGLLGPVCAHYVHRGSITCVILISMPAHQLALYPPVHAYGYCNMANEWEISTMIRAYCTVFAYAHVLHQGLSTSVLFM